MGYIEKSIEEAIELCNKHNKVLVATQDLTQNEEVISFEQKDKEEYEKIFQDVKTVASYMDDFVKQLRCFTEKQNIYDIKPVGVQKIVLLK